MIGVDLGQFTLDPFGSGVQRVLQQLALHWPTAIEAEFLVPIGEDFGALSSADAFTLLSSTFEQRLADHEAPRIIAERIGGLQPTLVAREDLTRRYRSWLMPEMSYDRHILARLRSLASALPLTMIGYDALPMSNPENYSFTPGTHGNVSEYFRILRDAQHVVCISEFSRTQLFDVLRRDRGARTEVAHPGGDHIPIGSHEQPTGRPVFLRVGTMEARKQPVEITAAFLAAVDAGLDAELVFIGSPSRVDVHINAAVQRAIDAGYPIRWITDASDEEVLEWMTRATAFLSYGIEGYGIPVLEVLRRGVPVMFDGIQPAAEIMEGRGALRMPLQTDPEQWRAMADQATSASRTIDAEGVPKWADFARDVADLAR